MEELTKRSLRGSADDGAISVGGFRIASNGWRVERGKVQKLPPKRAFADA
jgi:hypothetical protein